jgi:hypothetical protein
MTDEKNDPEIRNVLVKIEFIKVKFSFQLKLFEINNKVKITIKGW